VDIVSGDPDLIERVLFDRGPTFEPQTVCVFLSHSSQAIQRLTGMALLYHAAMPTGPQRPTFQFRGAGEASMVVTHMIRLAAREIRSGLFSRFENREDPCRDVLIKIDEEQKFGIQLELSSPLASIPQWLRI
jgi:hypothetical protein